MSEFWDGVSRRHGLLTTAEGVAEFGRTGFYKRARAGLFELVHRGIWRVAGSPTSELQTFLALAMAVDGIAGFRSTLALNGLWGYSLLKPELIRTSTGNIKRKFGSLDVTIHRSNFMPDHHVTEVSGIPTTTLARALCDVSAVMSLERLSKLVDNCKRLDLIEYTDLAQCREDIRARGRRKTTYLDEILAARIDGWVVGESPPEDKTRTWLEEAGYRPTAQHWVVANGKRRRLDVSLAEDRVAVEYQGIAGRLTPTTVENDSEKITDLQLAGWLVVLVTRKTTRYEFLRNVEEAIRIRRGSL